MSVGYYFIPFIAALIGWVTNYISIKMLFLPRKPKRILFIKFHGVIPKRLPQLAEKLGTVISETLLTKEVLKEQLTNVNTDNLESTVKEKINIAINKILDQNKMISAFLNESLINNITDTLTANITKAISESIETFGDKALDAIDFKSLVSKQIEAQDPKIIEERVWFILKTEFKFIERLGGVLGFIIGLLQLLMLYYESKVI